MALMSHRELAERPIAHCLLKCVHLLKFCMSANSGTNLSEGKFCDMVADIERQQHHEILRKT